MAVLSVPRPLQEQLLQVLEERFLRHVAESEKRTNAEITAVRVDLGKEITAVRVDLGKEIADVRKEITIQTRWILAVLGGAAVLIPILQRVMTALIP